MQYGAKKMNKIGRLMAKLTCFRGDELIEVCLIVINKVTAATMTQTGRVLSLGGVAGTVTVSRR